MYVYIHEDRYPISCCTLAASTHLSNQKLGNCMHLERDKERQTERDIERGEGEERERNIAAECGGFVPVIAKSAKDQPLRPPLSPRNIWILLIFRALS